MPSSRENFSSFSATSISRAPGFTTPFAISRASAAFDPTFLAFLRMSSDSSFATFSFSFSFSCKKTPHNLR
jgi:hypothetical protein